MDIEIRPVTEDEDAAYYHATERSFGHHFSPEDMELYRSITERDRTLAAFDGDEIVGTAGAFSLAVTIPGGELPMAGVTAVGVLPSHRRRGILTALMRRQLQDVRDRGEPLAGLWASEGSIYGRFGYGLASLHAELRADRQGATFLVDQPDSGRIALVEKDAALPEMRHVYERMRPTRNGMLSRGDRIWTMNYADRERWRHGASALFYALHRTGDAVDGFATYRIKSEWTDGIPGGMLEVNEVLAEHPQAYAALWRFLFGVDLIGTVEAWDRPIDDPLMHMLTEPRRLRIRVADAMYLRILDVRAALSSRRYAVDGRLVLDVRDPFGGFGEGRFELEGGPDGATCRATTAAPDLTLGAVDLGAMYLGGASPRALAGAGRVLEERPGALHAAWRLFATDAAPWCPYMF